MTRSILLISFYAPSKGHAGGLRLIDLYSMLRKVKPDLHLTLLTFEQPDEDWGTECVENIFDEVHRLPLNKFGSDLINEVSFSCRNIDFIDLQYHQCGTLINVCRKRWPLATIAFSPMESMLRACKPMLSADGDTDVPSQLKALLVKLLLALQEMRYARGADKVITVSTPDQDALTWLKPKDSVLCVPTGLSMAEFPVDTFSKSSNYEPVVVFFAYFGSRTNRESLLWYCREVHPRIRGQIADYIFRVVGRGLSQELIEMCTCDGVEFVGQVGLVQDGLSGSAIGIAPALGGAGVRGKIHHYAAMGIPCVASPLACEGLDYRNGESILIARSAVAFADACASLLKNTILHDQIGNRARQICLDKYTWTALIPQINFAYDI